MRSLGLLCEESYLLQLQNPALINQNKGSDKVLLANVDNINNIICKFP